MMETVTVISINEVYFNGELALEVPLSMAGARMCFMRYGRFYIPRSYSSIFNMLKSQLDAIDKNTPYAIFMFPKELLHDIDNLDYILTFLAAPANWLGAWMKALKLNDFSGFEDDVECQYVASYDEATQVNFVRWTSPFCTCKASWQEHSTFVMIQINLKLGRAWI